MKTMPQPIPYQGSKRNIAEQILAYFPQDVCTLIEPFAGSAAISVAAAHYERARQFYLNDLNKPLMDLVEIIIHHPKQIADEYEKLWLMQIGQERKFYDYIRNQFNVTHKPEYLLYLLARCVKASIRYNMEGDFNQSPDNRRQGRRPMSMRQQIFAVSQLLLGKTTIQSGDYKAVSDIVSTSDLVYLDPPYQGTSQNRDPRYYSGIILDELADFLRELNKRHIRFLLSYDGRTGNKTYGKDLPSKLDLHRIEIYAGRSSQSTLLGRKVETYESLYVSPPLAHELQLSLNHRPMGQNGMIRRDKPAIQLELGLEG
jgi:DNA adenine methylase